MPLLPGTPTSYSQFPEVSYNPAVVITARVEWHTAPSTTRSLVLGLTPPLARVAPITASSVAVTRTQLWRVWRVGSSVAGRPGSSATTR